MLTAPQTEKLTKVSLVCGVVGGPLFVVMFIVEGATRDGYNPLRHPVSSLAIGDLGWVETANFIITGLLMLTFAVGLRRTLRATHVSTWGPKLIGVLGIGLIGAGLFERVPSS